MNIFLCDDDCLIIKQLSEYLTEYFSNIKMNTIKIFTFNTAFPLLSSSVIPDIVFLDIEMPEINGIEIAKKLYSMYHDCIIMIVTSYSEYLDAAMDIHVFRYLDKPINKKRLFSSLDYAIKRLTDISGKITFEINSKFITLSKKDIVCAEAQLRNVNIYTPTEMYVSKKNMLFWKEQLTNPCFFQPHRSYIVNMNHIIAFDKTTLYTDNAALLVPISRNIYQNFKTAYLLFMENTR